MEDVDFEEQENTFQYVDDDEALLVLMHENNPDNVLTDKTNISSREIPPTPQLLSNVQDRLSKVIQEDDMDDDEIRTHRYWQKWGKKKAKDIVKAIHKDVYSSKKHKRKELVYSARTRENRYQQYDESDSDETEISLLSCSDLGKSNVHFEQTESNKKKKAKLKGKQQEQEEVKVDWSKVKVEGRSKLIDKLMAKDASSISTMVSGDIATVGRRQSYMDFMSPEEQQLILNTAYHKGLHGKQKSESTENVVSYVPKVSKKRYVRSNSRSSSAVSGGYTPKPPTERTPSRGCTPTPRYIAAQYRKIRRSESASGNINLEKDDLRSASPSSVSTYRAEKIKSVFSVRHSAHDRSEPDSVRKYQQGLRGIPDFEGTFTKTVREKIRRTVSAIHRNTGYGDSLNTMKQPQAEKGRFIDADYAKIPKYPQRVLITPHLSKVISFDIRKRMGRPRYHEIRKADIRYFDSQNPPLDNSNRNLIIFNWLLSVDEKNYEFNIEPKIVDLEGTERKLKYGTVLVHGDIMTRAATAMSRLTSALDDYSTFKTRSDFTGEVSGLDDDDDFSVGSAGDISDFYSPSATGTYDALSR